MEEAEVQEKGFRESDNMNEISEVLLDTFFIIIILIFIILMAIGIGNILEVTL